MHGSLLFKAILLILAVGSCTSSGLSSDVRLLVYKSAHSDFKSSDSNYDLNLDIEKNEFVAIRSIQEEPNKVLIILIFPTMLLTD